MTVDPRPVRPSGAPPPRGERPSRHREAGVPRGTVVPLLGAAVLLAVCGRPPPDDRPSSTRQVAGCWDLEPAGDGAERETVGRWIEEGALPDVLELDTVRAEAGDETDTLFVAWSHVRSRRQRRPLAAWRRVADDSVRVETPGALAGTVLRLGVDAGRLAGTATVFSDVVQPGADGSVRTAPVEGRSTDCPAPGGAGASRPRGGGHDATSRHGSGVRPPGRSRLRAAAAGDRMKIRAPRRSARRPLLPPGAR